MNLAKLNRDMFQMPEGTELPPLWELIYQEGIRSNHILFNATDLMLFEYHSSRIPHSILAASQDKIVGTIFDIINCSDLESMRNIIEDLKFEHRLIVFRVYQSFLSDRSNLLRAVLN